MMISVSNCIIMLNGNWNNPLILLYLWFFQTLPQGSPCSWPLGHEAPMSARETQWPLPAVGAVVGPHPPWPLSARTAVCSWPQASVRWTMKRTMSGVKTAVTTRVVLTTGWVSRPQRLLHSTSTVSTASEESWVISEVGLMGWVHQHDSNDIIIIVMDYLWCPNS